MTLNKITLRDIPLFSGITEDELPGLNALLKPSIRYATEGEFLTYPGDIIKEIGILLDGKIHMVSEDFWGNQNIIAEFTKGSFFGEAHSISGDPMFFSLISVEQTTLLFLNTQRILNSSVHNDTGIQKLYDNLLSAIIQKKLNYMRKADILSRRSLREKVSAFLSEEYQKQSSSSFTIPYDRQQMADYLSVDRSALSRELSKMKKEGILEYRHNQFQLKSM